MKNSLLILLLSFCTPLFSIAQSATSATIVWEVTDVENATANIHEGVGDKLITYPGNKIEWKDATDNLKFLFPVSSTIGTWENISTNGLIHFNFEMEGQPGEIIIQRSGNTLTAEIQIYSADTLPQTYILSLSSYTIQ